MPQITGQSIIEHSIAREYTAKPGPRYREEGDFSGQQFKEERLSSWFAEAQRTDRRLVIDLDGGYGYAPSFLEEAFGGLARDLKSSTEMLRLIAFKSEEEPYLIERIRGYIKDAND